MDEVKEKVLLYSPFAGIWRHYQAEHIVAQDLYKSGIEVNLLSCSGSLFGHC